MQIILKNTSRDSRGLTLAELLVVIGIIAVAAGISIPFYRSITMNINLDSAGRDLATDLRYAQQLSVTTQINHEVVFNIGANSYDIKNVDSGAIIKSQTVRSPVTIHSIAGLPSDTVVFNATGAAIDIGSIILTNTNGRELTIDIKPSGYVKIE